eukprot:1063043-Amphidinium_carterae.2
MAVACLCEFACGVHSTCACTWEMVFVLIRQALLGASHRWVENEVPQSAFWDFKWCATDSEADYRNLLEGLASLGIHHTACECHRT